MSTRAHEILQEILSLPPAERAELVEGILASLEPSDPRVLKLWAAEAEARLGAFQREELEAVSADAVFDDIDRMRSK